MYTTVILDGELGNRFGTSHRLDLTVPTPAEALRALCTVAKGFREYLQENARTEYCVFAGSRNLDEDGLFLPSGRNDIRIMPAIMGSKSAGVLQMIIGAVLIIAGLIITSGTFGAGAPFGSALIMSGIAMMVGGVAQLLFAPGDPSKTQTEKPGNRASYLFNGPVNTTGQGNCVAVCYGEVECGSQVVSAGIFAEEYVYPDAGDGTGYRDSGVGGSNRKIEYLKPNDETQW